MTPKAGLPSAECNPASALGRGGRHPLAPGGVWRKGRKMSVEFKHVEVEQEGPASEEEERIDLTMPDASTYATLDGELQKVLNSIEQLDWRLQDIDRGDKKVTPPTAEEIGEL